MQRSVRENIALPFPARSAAGARSTLAREPRRSTARSTDAPDRHARRNPRSGACPAATSRRSRSRGGWPAASRRCSASTRPAASTSARSSRSTRCSASSPGPGRRSSSTRRSSRRSSPPAIGRSSSSVVASSAEMPSRDADEPTLLRAAYNLPPDAAMPEDVAHPRSRAAAEAGRGRRRGRRRCRFPGRRDPVVTAATDAILTERTDVGQALARWARRNAWTLGLTVLFIGMLG